MRRLTTLFVATSVSRLRLTLVRTVVQRPFLAFYDDGTVAHFPATVADDDA